VKTVLLLALERAEADFVGAVVVVDVAAPQVLDLPPERVLGVRAEE
jgi:hypothetical protein